VLLDEMRASEPAQKPLPTALEMTDNAIAQACSSYQYTMTGQFWTLQEGQYFSEKIFPNLLESEHVSKAKATKSTKSLL